MDGNLISALARGYDPAERESELMRLQTQRNVLAEYPEERAYTREQRDIQRQHQKSNLVMSMIKDPALRKVALYPQRRQQYVQQLPELATILPESFSTQEELDSWGNKQLGDLREALDVEWKEDEEGIMRPLPKKMKEGQEIPAVKAPPKKEDTELFLDDKGRQVYLKKGGPIPPGWKKYEKEEKKEKEEKPPETIRTFETVTGISSSKRGTPEYKESYHQWQQDLKDDKTVLSSETVDKLSTFQTIHQTLMLVTGKADKLKDKFGPLSGRWEQLKVKFKEDPESAVVQRELKSLIQIAYGLSGKQISEREMVILREALLPKLEEPYGNFLASLNFASNWAARSYNNLLSGYKSAGYRVKAFEPLPIGEMGGKLEEPLKEETKTIGEKTYIKKNGKWYEQ